MLKYPVFGKYEYEAINESLYVVEYQLELERLEGELKELDHQFNQTHQPPRCTDEQIREAILDRFEGGKERKSTTESQSSCRELLDAFAAALDREGPAREVKLRPVLDRLMSQYMVFDAATFEADCAAVFREVDNSASQEHALNYFAERDVLTEKIAEHRKTLPKVFKNSEFPDQFRDRVVARLDEKKQYPLHVVEAFMKRRLETQINLAGFIAKCFVSDWRQRAPWFAVPVTVSGNAIDAIEPDERKRKWQRAYAMLGLGFAEKRLRYSPIYPDGTPPVRKVKPGELRFFDNARVPAATV